MFDGSLQPAFETSFRVLQERVRFSDQAKGTSKSDLADWGELCLAAGYADQARLLFQVAALRAGFSPQLLEEHERLGNRTGLWHGGTNGGGANRTSVATTQLAIAELTTFASAAAKYSAEVECKRSFADDADVEPHIVEPLKLSRITSAPEPAELAGSLFDLLRFPPQNYSEMGTALERVLAAVKNAGKFDARLLGAAPLPSLANGIGFESLQSFVLDTWDLFSGPYGSAALFYHAAHFDSCGLGPYFTNIQQIARNSSDIFELACVATEAAGADLNSEEALAPWIALLSRTLTGPLSYDVIDELGDRNSGKALDCILTRLVASIDDKNLSLIMRIRDGALDNGDYALASRAQRAVVDHRPKQSLEWLILGTIDRMAGRIIAAETSLRHCLSLDPGNEDAVRRVAALHGDFAPYEITMGFGSPEDRQLNRLRRRRGPAASSMLTRASQIGVEVNY